MKLLYQSWFNSIGYICYWFSLFLCRTFIMIVPDEKSNETPIDHTSTTIDKQNIDLKDESPSKFVNLSDHSMKKVEKIEYGYFVANIETLFATFLIPVLRQIYSDRNENIGRSYCTTILSSKTSKVHIFVFFTQLLWMAGWRIWMEKWPNFNLRNILSSEDEYLAFSSARTIINLINYGTKPNQHGNQLLIIVPLLSIIVILNFAICSPTNNQGINKKSVCHWRHGED
ncbi:hypothetical protein BLOT_011702 [Blomia tropicalis]|nr:hypothetical protein BLOT_011702 [Blomia tropicalis]